MRLVVCKTCRRRVFEGHVRFDPGCGTLEWPGRKVFLGGHPKATQERVLEALFEREGRTVSARELIDAVYSDRADGGPLWARNTIHITILRLRRLLVHHGAPVEIAAVWASGTPASVVQGRKTLYTLRFLAQQQAAA